MRLIDADALPIKFWGDRFVVVAKVDIENAPTVDAVKHGHWVSDYARIKDQCSICKMSVNWAKYKTPYCPNC